MYSGLKLTFASDRLPAIAAIVERELRVRQGDTYFAGMWKNSLLNDLVWTNLSHQTPPRSPTSAPTWAWPSSQVRVSWVNGFTMPALQLVDLSFVPVGPAHIGEVKDASIILRGPVLEVQFPTLRLTDVPSLAACLEIVSPVSPEVKVSESWTSQDFDWTSGVRPVEVGDTFSVILMTVGPFKTRSATCSGLILREVADAVFERMGVLAIEPRDVTMHSSSEETCNQWAYDFADSLPIRDVKII
jgi:hypothetical protein